MKDSFTRKNCFLITLFLLFIFALLGQCACDKIARESRHCQYWGYEAGLPYFGITAAVTAAVCFLFYIAVGFSPNHNKGQRILTWVLGVLLALCMLNSTAMYIRSAIDSSYASYLATGLWRESVDMLEEERKLWDLSNWSGHGRQVYEFSYEEYVDALDHLSLANDREEPYVSIVNERERTELVFHYFESDTMINVLSYFYGKWVWLVYTLLAIMTSGLAFSLWPVHMSIFRKILFCLAAVLYSLIVLMPSLNGCAILYNAVSGPPFTGTIPAYWERAILAVGPAVGTVLGLTKRKPSQEKKHLVIIPSCTVLKSFA